MIYVAILPLFHILSLKTSSKLRSIHIGCLQYKKSSINLSATKFDILFLDPMIDQLLVLNGLRNKLDESGNVIRNKARLVAQRYT